MFFHFFLKETTPIYHGIVSVKSCGGCKDTDDFFLKFFFHRFSEDDFKSTTTFDKDSMLICRNPCITVQKYAVLQARNLEIILHLFLIILEYASHKICTSFGLAWNIQTLQNWKLCLSFTVYDSFHYQQQ